jgi:hypothetical protein
MQKGIGSALLRGVPSKVLIHDLAEEPKNFD